MRVRTRTCLVPILRLSSLCPSVPSARAHARPPAAASLGAQKVMLKYKDLNEGAVLTVFLCAYIFMQSFAIPGSIVFSLLSGPLFGPIRGWCLVCFSTTTGAIACYFVSNLFMRRILLARFPARVAFLEQKVVENSDNIFYFLLSLRMSPLLPNWFINAASPVAGIPLRKFAAATFVGLMPINFLHVQAGARVQRGRPTDCRESASRRRIPDAVLPPPFSTHAPAPAPLFPCAGMTLGYAQSLSGALHDYRRVLLLLSLSLLALVPVYIKARRRNQDLGLHKRESSGEYVVVPGTTAGRRAATHGKRRDSTDNSIHGDDDDV